MAMYTQKFLLICEWPNLAYVKLNSILRACILQAVDAYVNTTISIFQCYFVFFILNSNTKILRIDMVKSVSGKAN